MIAYHFLRDDFTTGSGHEPAWAVGEERTWPADRNVTLCVAGYHSSPTWRDALPYAPGSVACLVDVSEPLAFDTTPGEAKQVSRRRRLLAACNVARELRMFAAECAERALERERAHGREPDARSWAAVAVVRRYADGQATPAELAAAGMVAWDAAGAAAGAAAWMAAWEAAEVAAGAAARAAAGMAAREREAEIDWQKTRLAELLAPLLSAPQRKRKSREMR